MAEQATLLELGNQIIPPSFHVGGGLFEVFVVLFSRSANVSGNQGSDIL